MAGCTDLAFRLLAREFGMELAFLEMVSAEALVRQNKKTQSLLKRHVTDKPLGAQLFGANPKTMAEAAQMIEEMGFEILDLNFGCPVPKITRAGAGSALMVEPKLAEKIFREVLKRIKKIPVTVKMRKGFKDSSGKEALEIARIAEKTGMSAVTVHGRTKAQGYLGKADWEIIQRVKESVKIPVFGNGDVLCPESAKAMMKQTGVDGIMIGRGALGNPWVYEAIHAALKNKPAPKPPTFADRKKAALKHFLLEIKTEGEKIGLMKSRRIVCWYFKNQPGASEFRNKANRAESAAEMLEYLEAFSPKT